MPAFLKMMNNNYYLCTSQGHLSPHNYLGGEKKPFPSLQGLAHEDRPGAGGGLGGRQGGGGG